MKAKVVKLTDVKLLRKANGFTTGKESGMSLKRAYALGHSPIRTQLFWVELTDIPLFVASQLVRSHVGVQFFQQSKRPDRGGEDFSEVCDNIALALTENGGDYRHLSVAANLATQDILKLPKRFDRNAPTDLAFIINAEAIINMSRKRLCAKASEKTREIWQVVCSKIGEVDSDLTPHLVKPCVYQGFCREAKPCGFCKTDLFKKLRENYLKLFINP